MKLLKDVSVGEMGNGKSEMNENGAFLELWELQIAVDSM